jgi:hypothetical protein
LCIFFFQTAKKSRFEGDFWAKKNEPYENLAKKWQETVIND